MVWRMRTSAKYPEAACVGHSGHNVAAMAERKDRQLDAQLFANPIAHGVPLGLLINLRSVVYPRPRA
jgi:hypothetical protein